MEQNSAILAQHHETIFAIIFSVINKTNGLPMVK